MVASTFGAVAKNLGQLCEKHGGQVSYFEHGKSLLKHLIEGKYELLMVELNFIEGEHRDLVSRIRSKKELQDLFVVVYAPAEIIKNEQAAVNGVNSILTAPFSDSKILSLFKRAFSLPKQCLFLSSSTQEEFTAALQSMGYDLNQVSSAKEALDDKGHNVPDFIIVEYNLSDMSTTEFVEQTKESNRLKNVPIMVAYNGREAGEIEDILKAGINDVILSPFASAQNIKRIQDKFPLPPRGRRLRALVVDDSPTIRDLIASMFKELDYQVETAENGFEGYKAVQRIKPDIITSDYDMPVLNGWEFCTEVRDHEEYKDIPIIMITTRATEMDLKKGEVLGVSAYLAKPFAKDTLKTAVETAIATARNKKEQETIAKFVAADTLSAVSSMVDEQQNAGMGESKHITVLFSDICAFSSKCERFSARKIINLLNTYFDLMVEVLSENNAIIDKFIGDAIVARFDSGDPAGDALDAVRGAWGMCRELERFNLDSFEEVQSRIGINSGEVILGNLGCQKHRLEYAMIGDNVNIGQRLESSAPKQGVMISESTYNLIKDHILVGERQEIEVKGKSEKVVAYVLEGFV